ncbi:RNA-binding S4 domain-containing protein [Sporomusa termitida]|uniref:S4 domain protein YaaA n=1 Tax=Sporomusa termitida TaxID=2377 RepID=A0A517E0G6_9FIRM|nr:RNA-binding S4 domain-containing protein [Sporomusa termitida]QDR83099.1 S4 domain protein YaaA [Sporomusa termitida]
MEEIEIHTAEINMDQLLKWAGIIDNGAHIKPFIENRLITLNGTIITERRKKVRPGDIIAIKDIGSWRIVTGEV